MDNKKLFSEIEELIHEVENTSRYSMSRIYGLHNKIFNRSEAPKPSASCLIRKFNDLKNWLYQKKNAI